MLSMKATKVIDSSIQYEVSRFGTYLATRATGAKLRDDLERVLREGRGATAVEISFSRVQAVTVSFADEFVGRLLTSRAAGDLPEVHIVLSGLNEEVREAVAICLERRAAVALHRSGRRLELLGADSVLEETFSAVQRYPAFRASELASQLKITPQNANNRLKRLVDHGVLLRRRDAPEGGGREYIYRLPK
jgi:DNA-binding transcriptional ArsR family regulator